MAEKTFEQTTFSPKLFVDDPVAHYWIRQVSLRLRREICWAWYERGLLPENHNATLPPCTHKASESLGLTRNFDKKKNFFQEDITCRYLSEQIEVPQPQDNNVIQGSFAWVKNSLNLDETASFILALALSVSFDSAVGSVIAACLNDPLKTLPNLALAQMLWDRPEQMVTTVDPYHPLFRYGLLQMAENSAYRPRGTDWDSPICVPPLIVQPLLFADSALPGCLSPVSVDGGIAENLQSTASLLAARLKTARDWLAVVPVSGRKGSSFLDVVTAIAWMANRKVVEYSGEPEVLGKNNYFNTIATLCWLNGVDLYLPQQATDCFIRDQKSGGNNFSVLFSLPITLYLSIGNREDITHLPQHLLLPKIEVPRFSYAERYDHWWNRLGSKASAMEPEIAECARRFRLEKETIDEICDALLILDSPFTAEDLQNGCRAEVDLDMGELAQKVEPRFGEERLILPEKQSRQFQEIIRAMQSLAEVHYHWGTADAWNEGGISVLFGGPPGTGKTMAAEVLATKLRLPMYRIDLSQVVNKYIGETEKNLKRVFDSSDVSDIILFFDEADALFGKRSEVKDAHDRYANLEISYLLERMERFKGLAILATNRKKDLDPAFLRRLRYIIDFPLPDVAQRREIWRQVIPQAVDSSSIDTHFLARQFQLTGGHIRSIVFNACLQSAGNVRFNSDKNGNRLSMEQVIISLKREYDKMNRSISLEYFGPYAHIIQAMESSNAEPKN